MHEAIKSWEFTGYLNRFNALKAFGSITAEIGYVHPKLNTPSQNRDDSDIQMSYIMTKKAVIGQKME